MKIIVIMGSPRKKDGYRICKQLEETMNTLGPCEFEYLYLSKQHVEACKGCDQCFQTSEHLCPCRDDLPILKQKMLDADGIIFASPVYAYQVTSDMKRFIDRLSYLFHRQELAGKPAVTITTTAGGGGRNVSSYLKMTASGWGCHLSGQLCITSPRYFPHDKNSNNRFDASYHNKKTKELRAAAGRFYQSIANTAVGHLPVPTFFDLYLFQGLRTKTFTSSADYEFWKEKGWLNQHYFYPAQLGPLKRLYSISLASLVNFLCRNIK